MSGYRIYQHVFPSWEVYPRVHYFQKRFKDLLERFLRITGALPESFREKNVEIVLEKIKCDFDGGLQLTVIGKEDIDDKNLVISAAVDTEQHKHGSSPEIQNFQERDDAKLNVVVCHIDPESLGEKAIKDTTVVMDLAHQVSNPRSILLKCDPKHICPEVAITNFKNDIIAYRQQSLQQEDILIGSTASELQKRISDKLEENITDGFSKISSSLQRFEPDGNVCNEITGEIIESEEVGNKMRDFLLNIYSLKDLIGVTNETEVMNKTFVDRVLHRLCHEIRCAAVPPLARKYNQKVWICNSLLHEIEFEETLVSSVSKNTKYHLSKIENALESLSPGKKTTRKFLFVQYLLRTDMKKTFEETEKKFSGMQRISVVMKRLLFETNGYLKQTNLGLAAAVRNETVFATISSGLRQDLLSIKGVYGLGTIYMAN